MDWCIGNPPYSCLLGWIRHSFKVADNVVCTPLHRVFANYEFMDDIRVNCGGVKEILLIGTGATAGFPFTPRLSRTRRATKARRGWAHRAQHSEVSWRRYGVMDTARLRAQEDTRDEVNTLGLATLYTSGLQKRCCRRLPLTP